MPVRCVCLSDRHTLLDFTGSGVPINVNPRNDGDFNGTRESPACFNNSRQSLLYEVNNEENNNQCAYELPHYNEQLCLYT